MNAITFLFELIFLLLFSCLIYFKHQNQLIVLGGLIGIWLTIIFALIPLGSLINKNK
ncbi:hypothetical protein CPAV1605_1320 [seawater metagenome]|uniref:Uncharacterized protein n=1 Tax=seawater metagenome TaxID=1561972 RepID=A0A5E8CJQ7_9ZZZZ